MRGFEDHFALGSELYAKARPCYPMALSAWLTEQAPRSKLAWDAGTGSGRLAHQLNSHFDRVYATDASQAQLDQATPAPGLEFALERAEQPTLVSGSVDLVTVAAAAHWLDLQSFYQAVRRVAAPGGVLALFSYGTALKGSPFLGEVLDAYAGSIEPYWPSSYRLVAEQYRSLSFPFERVDAPEFAAESSGDLEHLLNILRTWSGSLRALRATGCDPVAPFEEKLRWAWNKKGPSRASRMLFWPIFGHVGRLP